MPGPGRVFLAPSVRQFVDQPALFAMPITFALTFAVSLLDRSARASSEVAAFEDQYVRAQTGYGAEGASKH